MTTESADSKEVTAALARKDADFLEKFVGKVLKLSSEHWAKLTNEAYEKSPAGSEEYDYSFAQWHRLRLNQVHIDGEIAGGSDRTEDMPWKPTEDTTTSTETTSGEG